MHATERQIADRLERQGRRRGWKVLAAIFHVDPDTLRRWRRCPDSFRVVHLAVLLLLEQQESRP